MVHRCKIQYKILVSHLPHPDLPHHRAVSHLLQDLHRLRVHNWPPVTLLPIHRHHSRRYKAAVVNHGLAK